MKTLARVALGVAILFVLVIGGLFIAPNLINWNGYKPQIAAAVRAATGHDLRIDGDLHVTLLPAIRIRADGIHLLNAPRTGAIPSEIVAIDRFALDAEVLPLLRHRLVVDSLVLTKPAINLEVDQSGRANWTGAPATASNATSEAPPAGGSPWVTSVRLNDAKIDQGQLSYRNAVTGQTLDAKAINLTAAMAEVTQPASIKGSLTLNNEPVTVDFSLDSLGRLAQGQQAKVKLALDTKELRAHFDGSAQQRPVPGLNGTFDMDVGSVGRLLAWLGRPLAKAQPDPGPVAIHAVFSSAGAKTAIENASITGTGFKVKASGTLDATGPVTKVALTVDSSALDIDRYLPASARLPTRVSRPAAARGSAAAVFATLSDKPFDLRPLQTTDADIKVTIAGVKAMGYEVGRVAFGATARAGRLTANLSELALYGGDVTGTAKLDASGKALGAEVALNINHVTIDKLARAASGPPVSGALTAMVTANAQGGSPRALVESLRGKLAADLGGIRTAAARGISGLKLDVNLPGANQPTTIKGSLVYNGEPVTLDATVGSPRQMLAANRFPAKLALASKPISLSYAGAIQRQPIPGLDGTLDADAPSVGRLAAWLGRPLAAKQTDPGPLKIHAVMTAAGPRVTLKDATISGKALRATAEGTLDRTRTPGAFNATVNIQNANLDAYLPASAQGSTAASTQSAGWSTEPYDFSMLRQANGTAKVQFSSVRYRGLDVTQGALKATVTNGVLTLALDKMALAQGTITGTATIDASGAVPKIGYQMAASGVQARPLLMAFANSGRLSGTIAFQTNGNGHGRNQKEVVESLNGAGQFSVRDGAIYGINLASALRQVGSLGFSGSETQKTDFAELSGTFTIKNGVLENRDLKMLAPVVRLTGNGTAPMPPRTIDYTVEAKLVATLQGQGGADALAGLPIPIRITGPWSKPSYQVDWKSVFTAMAKDPTRLKNLPSNLSNAAKNFGVSLPIPGGTGGKLFEAIPGMPKLAPSAPQQTGQVPPAQQPAKPSLPGALKGLFGN